MARLAKTIIYHYKRYEPGEIPLLDLKEPMTGKQIYLFLNNSYEWVSISELRKKGINIYEKDLAEFSEKTIIYKKKNHNKYFLLSSIIADVKFKRNCSAEIKNEFESLDEDQKKIFFEHLGLIDYMVYKKTGKSPDPYFFPAACIGLINAIKNYDSKYKLKSHLCLYIGGVINNWIKFDKIFSLNDCVEFFENKKEAECLTIIKSDAKLPEEELMQSELEGLIGQLLSNLKPKEREIIEKRFCVGSHKDKKPLIMEEIADSFGNVKATVHNTEKRALKKMRKDPISDRLKIFVE